MTRPPNAPCDIRLVPSSDNPVQGLIKKKDRQSGVNLRFAQSGALEVGTRGERGTLTPSHLWFIGVYQGETLRLEVDDWKVKQKDSETL